MDGIDRRTHAMFFIVCCVEKNLKYLVFVLDCKRNIIVLLTFKLNRFVKQ
jgi:hypothetical protein